MKNSSSVKKNFYEKTIAIDFNGVLDTYAGAGIDTPPAKGAGGFLQGLIDSGFRVVILTCVYPAAVWDWLIAHDLHGYISEVTNQKPPALCYVDDRAVCHRGDFAETLLNIRNFAAHWERGDLILDIGRDTTTT